MKKIIFLILILTLSACRGDDTPPPPPNDLEKAQICSVTWDIVTTYVDGTPIEEPVGYKMYCSSIPGGQDGAVPVDAGQSNILPCADFILADGIWYCAVTAYIPGMESDRSNEVTILREAGNFYKGL